MYNPSWYLRTQEAQTSKCYWRHPKQKLPQRGLLQFSHLMCMYPATCPMYDCSWPVWHLIWNCRFLSNLWKLCLCVHYVEFVTSACIFNMRQVHDESICDLNILSIHNHLLPQHLRFRWVGSTCISKWHVPAGTWTWNIQLPIQMCGFDNMCACVFRVVIWCVFSIMSFVFSFNRRRATKQRQHAFRNWTCKLAISGWYSQTAYTCVRSWW